MICRCVVFGGRPGYMPVRQETERGVVIGYAPCPDCMGSGIVSCCDGAAGWAADVTNAPPASGERVWRETAPWLAVG